MHIKYSVFDTIGRIASELPCRTRFRRRCSAPELLTPVTATVEGLYEIGNCLRLELPNKPTSTRNRVIFANIVKVFTPITMAPAMVVHIYEPALDLEGAFVLKMYDRRYADRAREHIRFASWTPSRDMQLESRQWDNVLVKYFERLMAESGHPFYDPLNDASNQSEENEEKFTRDLAEIQAREEMFIHAAYLKMYRNELEVYRRAREHTMDGIDCPRFISTVRIPHAYTSKNCSTGDSGIQSIPGILMQYLPGFPIMDLYEHADTKPLRSSWQALIDDAVRSVNTIVEKLDVYHPDCHPRNTVVHWDPIGERWKCKMLDFGHCNFQEEGMSIRRWRESKAWLCTEKRFGKEMQIFLKQIKGFDATFTTSQYEQDLVREFQSW